MPIAVAQSAATTLSPTVNTLEPVGSLSATVQIPACSVTQVITNAQVIQGQEAGAQATG